MRIPPWRFKGFLILLTAGLATYSAFKFGLWVPHQHVAIVWTDTAKSVVKNMVLRGWPIYKVIIPFSLVVLILGFFVGCWTGEFLGFFTANKDFKKERREIEFKEQKLDSFSKNINADYNRRNGELQQAKVQLDKQKAEIVTRRSELAETVERIHEEQDRLMARENEMEQKLKQAIEERKLAKKKSKALKAKLDGLQKQKRM